MIEVDSDQTLADIRDTVRQYQDEVPELQEVKISANKAELIEQVNEALDDYLQRVAAEDGEEVVFDPQDEKVIQLYGEWDEVGYVGLSSSETTDEAGDELYLSEKSVSREEEFDVDEDAKTEDSGTEDSGTEDVEPEDNETEDDGGLKPGQAQGSPSSAHPTPQQSTIP